MYAQPGIDQRLVTRVGDVYLKNLDMPELIEKARKAVMDHTAQLLRKDPEFDVNYVVLDLPCTFFMLRSLRYAAYLCRIGITNRCQPLSRCKQVALGSRDAFDECHVLYAAATCGS
jgi:hypothetical protein